MDVEEAIRTRRSVGRVKDVPVPRELVEKLIEAAVWAPNHYMTEPWKFIVMTGEGRRVLGKAYADIALEMGAERSQNDEREERLANETAKAFRAPLIIAVVCSPSDAPKISRTEEFAAVHAAIQNLLLAAHANGLGAIWRSGEPMYHPMMRLAFGLQENEEMAGFVYIGYPDITPPAGRRTLGTAKTVWLEE